MAIQLSPGVNVSEIDLTTIVPAVSTSIGAFAGLFRWGPVGERSLVESEDQLVARFAKPTSYNAETFFTAANFLSYTNVLYVSRAANTSGAVVNQQFLANSVGGSVSNTYMYVASGNTAGIEPGMFVYQSSNTTSIPAGSNTYVVSVQNTSCIVLSMGTNSALSTTLYFGWPETSYTALGLEEGTFVSNLVNQIVKNENEYTLKSGNFENGVTWVAKYPGYIGNSLRVSVVDNADSFSSNVTLSNTLVTGTLSTQIGNNQIDLTFANDSGGSFAASVVTNLSLGDQILVGNNTINLQYMKLTGVSEVTTNATASVVTLTFETPYRLKSAFTSGTLNRTWEFYNAVGGVAPGRSLWQASNGSDVDDEVHVVVVDEGGHFTGTPGTILETFKGVSRATDAKNPGGTSNYYKNVINQSSSYIWWGADRALATSAPAASLTASESAAPGNYQFQLGTDGKDESEVDLAVIASGFDMFASKEDVDISIILQGRPLGGTTAGTNVNVVNNFLLTNYIIDNIVHTRKDCIVCVSPDKGLLLNSFGQEAVGIVDWRNIISDSSYSVMDSGYKYQYDRYNDVYRWIPLNGDIGGIIARTDQTNDAWWSPAGFNRGHINNVVKLAFNPKHGERDLLYVNGVNPVVTFPGQGTVLYGDKTLQSKPSAFDRINVRRLFIVLEKAIARAAQYSMFEFNDSFTRAQFKNLVTPYLRTVQGRRGITDFMVVCDDTNNTPQIVDSNQFVGDIYIKPARSINFIQLNFVAVGTGVQFSQVVGQF